MLFTLLCIGFSLAPQDAAGAQAPSRLAQLAPLGAKQGLTAITDDHDPRHLELKFVDGEGVELIGDSFQAQSLEVYALDAYLTEIGAKRRGVFSQSPAWLKEFQLKGESNSGQALHDLTLFFGLELAEDGRIGEVCDVLNSFGCVELAYPLPGVSDPVWLSAALVTPDYEPSQGYRGPAPVGIDADYGNTFAGGTGLGTIIADVETGWTDDHEDLAHQAQGNFVGLPGAPYPWNHGTAVLGELIGEDNGFGVRGLCPSSAVRLSSHEGNVANIPTAVMNAIAAVGVGDMVLLEVQCSGTPPGPFPCEYVPSTFAAVQAATANGIHVFAAAGNGDNDLDQAAYGGLFDRNVRDSGAVMVGASDGASLNKASFSNYGSRLDAHGWGRDVTTTGYGDLQGGADTQTYTLSFSGTSSASPIVLGAGNILNSIERSVHGAPLAPLALRALLTNSGTPQGSGGNIGPRPDVRAAIAVLNLPRIEVSGNPAPGGMYTVTSSGPVGAIYALTAGASLRNDPWFSPFGEFFLANPWQRVTAGVMPPAGRVDFQAQVPNDAGLSGTTYLHYQGWMRYAGTSGGSFSNYAPVEVQ